jgi:hypothetical protein
MARPSRRAPEAPAMHTSESFHVLRAASFSEAPVAVARADLRALAYVTRSGSLRRLAALLAADAAFTVSPFDRLAVVERAGGAARVVAVEGRARGREGWAPAAWLHPDGRPAKDLASAFAAAANPVASAAGGPAARIRAA